MQFDVGVYFLMIATFIVVMVAAVVVAYTKEEATPETRKIRFAAATFTGFLMLIIWCSYLYFAAPEDRVGRAKEIFERVMTLVSLVAGTVLGFLFGIRERVVHARDERFIPPEPEGESRPA
jgi:predicted membrane channel-forming protein YqfA (hemolysin III family)